MTVPLSILVLLAALPLPGRADVDYAQEVKPLLRERCYTCHGVLKQKAQLRLDTVAFMLQGGKSGPVFTRGDGENSLLLKRISTTQIEDRMPPEHEGEPLSTTQVGLLLRWIQQGAPAPVDEKPELDLQAHWAFRAPQRTAPPRVNQGEWVRNPIDAFIASQHAALGLAPAPEAPRGILLRRLYLDLIGLPPSVAELTAGENDSSPDWYDRAVDRLLADPRHGERWARHWMDIWRYSDWWGLGDQLRNSQKHLWHWRDWIIESLNADVPYDEMIRLMLAGDELFPGDLGRLRATGYLGRNYFLFNRNQWLEETVEHVGKAFLGLTLNCAKCHDHKYDPIAQVDFYRMRAFFEPYQVRLDMLPGEPDLSRDGLPRVFDADPPPPTFRFVRGQEKDPDKSVPILPGVPELLAFREVVARSVELPPDAWQPERRPWVRSAYLNAARSKLEAAEASLARLREKLRAASRTAEESELNAAELKVSQLGVEWARAEMMSVDRRLIAMQDGWARPEGEPDEESHRRAVVAERLAVAARMEHQVAELELRRRRAAADQRASLDKELQTAREALTKHRGVVESPVSRKDPYARLSGAAWTPTRFLDSTKDDPQVGFASRSTGRRTALAEWITDPRNPLTARVAVNHLWMRHLGAPLVPSVFDFGRKNGPPVEQGLVDWLASELVANGWSMKHIHRLIVTSSTYRMSSSLLGGDNNLAKDPDNLRWWRRVPVRMEAQLIRDVILSLAGRLDPVSGGPPVPPSEQEQSRRRSLYFVHSNNDQNLFLATFDDAAVKECYRREQSVVPQQALALSNSKLVQESAPRIAARLAQEIAGGGSTQADGDLPFVRHAFVAMLGFEPTEAETAAALHTLDRWRQLADGPSDQAKRATARGNLVWALLNHNDFVTIR